MCGSTYIHTHEEVTAQAKDQQNCKHFSQLPSMQCWDPFIIPSSFCCSSWRRRSSSSWWALSCSCMCCCHFLNCTNTRYNLIGCIDNTTIMSVSLSYTKSSQTGQSVTSLVIRLNCSLTLQVLIALEEKH